MPPAIVIPLRTSKSSTALPGRKSKATSHQRQRPQCTTASHGLPSPVATPLLNTPSPYSTHSNPELLISRPGSTPPMLDTIYTRVVADNGVFFTLNSIDMAQAMAMVRTMPPELKLPRELSMEEDDAMQFWQMVPGIPRFICPIGESRFGPIFSHMLLSPEMLHGTRAMRLMIELRERLLRRDTKTDLSAWESRARSLSGKEAHFTIGPTQECGHQHILPSAFTVANPEYAVENAYLVSLIGQAVADICERFIPKETRDRLIDRYHADVTLGVGHHENRFTSSVQVNITKPDGGLAGLGDFSQLHVDHDDDPTRYTVLFTLSHLPAEYWPGRFALAALREYCVLHPMSVLLFQGVQPHKGIEAQPRDSSIAPQYSNVAMDTEQFVISRLNVVTYPKKYMTLEAPVRLKMDVNGFLLQYKGLAAFGTLRNLHTFFARRDMWLKLQAYANDPSVVIPTGTQISQCHRWLEDGVEMAPSPETIDRVRECVMFEGQEEEWNAYKEQCDLNLAFRKFTSNQKVTEIVWHQDWRKTTALESTRHRRSDGTTELEPTRHRNSDGPAHSSIISEEYNDSSAGSNSQQRTKNQTKRKEEYLRKLGQAVKDMTNSEKMKDMLRRIKSAPAHDHMAGKIDIRGTWESLMAACNSPDLMATCVAAFSIAEHNLPELEGLEYVTTTYLQWQCNMAAMELTVDNSATVRAFVAAEQEMDLGSPLTQWLKRKIRQYMEHAAICEEADHEFPFMVEEGRQGAALPRIHCLVKCRDGRKKRDEAKIVTSLMKKMFLEPYAQRYLVRSKKEVACEARSHGYKVLHCLVAMLRNLRGRLGGDSFFFLPGFHALSVRFRGERVNLNMEEEKHIIKSFLSELRNQEVFNLMVELHKAMFERFLPNMPLQICTDVPTEADVQMEDLAVLNQKRVQKAGGGKRSAQPDATPAECYQLAVDISRGTAVAMRTGDPADNTSRMKVLHQLVTSQNNTVLADRLICARQASPSGKAVLNCGLERGGKVLDDGWLVLANVLCYRLLYFGNVELLRTWRLFPSGQAVMDHIKTWERKSRQELNAITGQKRKRVIQEEAIKSKNSAIAMGYRVYGCYAFPQRNTHDSHVRSYFDKSREIWSNLCRRGALSWISLRKALRDTRLHGLGGRLLAPLAVSDMTRLGWCPQPTDTDWPELLGNGALKGLKSLYGIKEGKPIVAIINVKAQDFMRKLAADLSSEDQETLVFDRIFVEHLLCKVVRFNKELKDQIATMEGNRKPHQQQKRRKVVARRSGLGHEKSVLSEENIGLSADDSDSESEENNSEEDSAEDNSSGSKGDKEDDIDGDNSTSSSKDIVRDDNEDD